MGRGRAGTSLCCCPNFKTAFWEWMLSLLKVAIEVGLTHLHFLLESSGWRLSPPPPSVLWALPALSSDPHLPVQVNFAWGIGTSLLGRTQFFGV